ncbi:MAG: signal peptidase I [Terriglobales bacterium]
MPKPPKNSKPKQTKPEETRRETPMEFIGSMAVILVTGLFIITFNLQAFEIPSSSMENTLLIGDHVFVDRITYAPESRWTGPVVPYREIRRGDIVVFLSPAEAGLYVVKRVVGIPGDRIHLRDGVVYRNGEAQQEPYVIRQGGYPQPYRDNFPSLPPTLANVTSEWQLTLHNYVDGEDLVVPPGHYFMMGDNREASYDSRFWGFVPRENVIGRPVFIYWSFETPPGQYQQTAVNQRLRHLGYVALHFFDKTRWSRTFNRVR